jgi:hypothetical protein
MKTNKEKNQEFDAKQKVRVRPKGPTYNWQPLEAVIRQWITGNK